MLTKHVLRAVASGALAVGLLATAPTADAHAAAQSSERQQQSHRERTAKKIVSALEIARKQKGDPYRYGAAGPGAFDCSGLTYFAFRRAGFGNIPRTSSAQAGFAHRISRAKMQRGDLMFFYDGGGVYHVGVFAGAAKGQRYVLHSPYSGTRVRTDRVWTDRWFPGTLRFR
ncbi:C40 family peptidase [Nocardioides pyridinolyticus]